VKIRTAALTAAAGLALTGAFVPANAAAKEVKESYEVGPLTPDPTPIALGEICAPTLPSAIDSHPFKVPGPGTLKVDIDFVGDWALGMRDSKGARLAESDGTTPETDESMQVKFKKATDVVIEACNFAGAPTATVDLVFTPAK
jgi:hypothetical protein